MKCTPTSHEQLKRDDTAWSALAYVGRQLYYDDRDLPAYLELRNCKCGSTLCRQVPEEHIESDVSRAVRKAIETAVFDVVNETVLS